MKIERRVYESGEVRIEARAEGKATPVIGGYAAMFNRDSVDLGGFTERIAPGAFAASLDQDIRALYNHNTSDLLGRTASGTLSLAEDSMGLTFRLDLPDTQAGRDVATLVERRDITGMSFGFVTRADNWAKVAGTWMRTLLDVQLIEISPVVFPAYPDTAVGMRAAGGSVEEALIGLRHAEALEAARMRRLSLLEKSV